MKRQEKKGTFFSEVVLNFFFCSFSIAGRGKSMEQRVIDQLRRNSKAGKKSGLSSGPRRPEGARDGRQKG